MLPYVFKKLGSTQAEQVNVVQLHLEVNSSQTEL